MRKLLNLDYACIHGTYWMFYGVISSFGSVFLLANGFSNSQIGMTLAASNILAVVLQPVIADLADRTKRLSITGMTGGITVMMMVLTVGLFAFRGSAAALSVIFVLLIAWHTVLQPLFNSLSFRLQESGIPINFGIARSMGSLAYSALMAVLGTWVQRWGVMVLPMTGEAVLVMLMISLLLTGRHFRKAKKTESKQAEPAAEDPIPFRQFISRNRMFFIVNLGVVGLYFSNSILNNYMAQIVTAVGGDSEDMGRILSLMAFLEIPTMVCFNLLRRWFPCQTMIKVAAIGFTIKIGLCWMADSVAMIFAAQFFQLVAFALFLPAMVHFINEIMRRGEAIRGQALFTTMVTVTTIFSSVVGGIILDMGNAETLTFSSFVVTAAGAVLILLTVGRIKT